MASPPEESGLRRIGVAAWSLLGTLLLLGSILWLVGRIWIIVPPLILAGAIVYVLNPFVSALQQRGVARWLGSCLSYTLLLGLLTLVGYLVIPSVADQASALADDFPRIYDDLVSDLEDLGSKVGFSDMDLPRYEELRDELTEGSGSFFDEQLGRITDFTLDVLEAVFLLLIAPVVAFYFLLDLPKTRETILGIIPRAHQAEITFIGRQLGRAVGGFLRGQLLVAIIVGVMTSFGFWLVDLPFWLIIGMIAGFLNIIPFVGPWVGGTLGVLTALATRDLQTAIWVGLVALVVQQIDNHFVSPTVLRATVRLHPAVIILGLVAGTAIGGFWGVLLAVPVMASVKIVAGHYWRTRVLGQSWEEAAEAMIIDDVKADTVLTRLLGREGDDPGAASESEQ